MKQAMTLAAVAVLQLAVMVPARADDVVRVGKDVVQGLPMMALNVGLQQGIFARHGVDAQELDFAGAAKMQMAIAAGEVDIGIAGGPEIAYILKDAPEIAVAAVSFAPVELGISVPYDSPIKTAADLRGKRVFISTVGGLSWWLVREFSRTEGWGPDAVTPVALGGSPAAELAALKTHQVDATIMLSAFAMELQQRQTARQVVNCAAYVPDFIAHTLLASNEFRARNPALLRRFLQAWLESVAWMTTHKPETVQIAMQISNFPEAIQAAEYDAVMPTISRDGRFAPKGLAVLAQSFVDAGVVEQLPDMSQLTTEAYLP